MKNPDRRRPARQSLRQPAADFMPHRSLLLADGRVKHVQEQCESVFDSDGKPLRSIGTVQDVSERVLKDQALRESEERFRTIADYTFGWEYWLGTHGELLYVNAACERISGYSQAEFSTAGASATATSPTSKTPKSVPGSWRSSTA